MAHPMAGLAKWLTRAEWQEPLAEIVAEHVGAACDDEGVAIDELEEVIGKDAFINAWGAACEDFMTRDLDDGRNVADDYLKRRGWKESPATREYIQALRRSVVSLYEVVAVEPGLHFTLRDHIRPDEPIRVDEPDRSRHLRPGDLLGARLFKVRQRMRTSEIMLGYSPGTAAEIEESIAEWIADAKAQAPEVAAGFDLPADAPPVADLVTPTLMLEEAAALFTDLWLRQVLAGIFDAVPPRIVNRDGDPLEHASATYPLGPDVTADDLQGVLGPLAIIEQAPPREPGPPTRTAKGERYAGWTTHWHWIDPEAEPRTEGEDDDELAEAEPGVLRVDPRSASGYPVLGELALKAGSLQLVTHTAALLERGRALLEAALAGLVGAPEVEVRRMIDVMADVMADAADAEAGPTPHGRDD